MNVWVWTKTLYFPVDRNTSLKIDIVFGQVMMYSRLGEQLEVSGGERGNSKKIGHGNLNEAILCLLVKKGTRRQNTQGVPFFCGIIWCLSSSFWNHYHNLARLTNKIEIWNKGRRPCFVRHYLFSSMIIEKFVSKKNKKAVVLLFTESSLYLQLKLNLI